MRSSYEYMNYLQVVQVFVRTPTGSKFSRRGHCRVSTTAFEVQRTYVLSQRSASEQWTQRTRPAALLRESFSVPPTARDNFAIKVAPVEQSVNVSQITHWLLLIKNSSVRTDASELHHSHFTFGTVYA
jgi:hypothetical protein